MAILNIKHKGLKRWFTRDDPSKVDPNHIDKLEKIMDALEAATHPADLRILGKRWHPLKGNRAGQFAVDVDENWRITYGWSGDNAIDVDYEDYH